jgi:YegS/Rv2252/BmrU family lipid kinase
VNVLVIFNPESGNRNPKTIKTSFLEAMRSFDIEYELFESSNFEDILERTRKASLEKVSKIIAIGGDGTVNQIINGMAESATTLGIIPTGTANLLATALGIPADVKKALKIIFEGKQDKIDLGKINNRYFAITAGCGFDAKIMKNVDRNKKKFLGFLAYFIEGFIQAIIPERSVFQLNIDGKKIKKRAVNVLFVNTGNLFGNFLTLVPDASLTDGFLDICIYSPTHTGEYIPVLWNIITKQKYTEEHKAFKMQHFKAKEVYLKCRPRLPVQADGDLIGYPPVHIKVCPDALSVCMPFKIDSFIMNPEEYFRTMLDKAFKDNDTSG